MRPSFEEPALVLPIRIGSSAWWQWLDRVDATAFRFEEGRESFTARRETQRHRQYWYAYRRRHGRLQKLYLGRGGELTPARLRETARRFHELQRVVISSPASPDALAPDVANSQPGNLPLQLTAFVGRQDEIGNITNMLGHARLVTITGSGGMGKTRLALELAARLSRRYLNGTWQVELSGISDGSDVAKCVAAALGLREQPGRGWIEAISDALRTRSLLLILDNCEHVLDACAEVAASLLSNCHGLHIVATSREAIGIPGEVIWPLAPLHTEPPPSSADTLCEAVELFLDRAHAVRPSFSLTVDANAAVVELCRTLDGIPLGIELAAAHANVLSAKQMLGVVGERLRLLRNLNRKAPPRHQTLSAAIDSSYALLSAREKAVFEQLSAFRGGWDIDSIAAIAPDLDRTTCLDLVERLVRKSLVVAEPDPTGNIRYRFLETIRQFASERLDASGQSHEMLARHAARFLALAEQSGTQLEGPYAVEWMGKLEMELDNIRTALRYYLHTGPSDCAQRFGIALWRFWLINGHLNEARGWLQELLELPSASATRTRLLHAAARIENHLGNEAGAKALAEESLAISRTPGNPPPPADVLRLLGLLHLWKAEVDSAQLLFDEALELATEASDHSAQSGALQGLAEVACLRNAGGESLQRARQALNIARERGGLREVVLALRQLGRAHALLGEYDLALRCFEEGVLRADEFGDPYSMAHSREPLAHLLIERGHALEALPLLARSLTIWKELGNWRGFPSVCEEFGRVAARLGHPDHALELAAAAASIRRSRRLGVPDEKRQWLDRWLEDAQHSAGRGRAAAWAAGEALALDEVVELALSIERLVLPTNQWELERPLLTDREREVALLIAEGLSDRAIAQRLIISARTAHAHVHNILRKLGMTSRVQVAAWVAQGSPEARRTASPGPRVGIRNR
jgi:non-specific serine/threonine protein kinase